MMPSDSIQQMPNVVIIAYCYVNVVVSLVSGCCVSVVVVCQWLLYVNILVVIVCQYISDYCMSVW